MKRGGAGASILGFVIAAVMTGAVVTARSQVLELPAGLPLMLEVPTPSGKPERTQRLFPFPFLPPDLTMVNRDLLSKENNWYTKRDKRKIDELGLLDFYTEGGVHAAAVLPKLHNTSAGMEIYEVPENVSKADFQRKEGPYRPGRTTEFMNRRSGRKLAKFKMAEIGECGLAYFHLSRLLGKLVEVPPATHRTLSIEEFNRVAKQAYSTGNPSCTYFWGILRQKVAAEDGRYVMPGGDFVFGSIAENPRGEDSSPPGYWTLDRIRQKRFYRVITSRAPVGEILDLEDPACLQDLVLARDLVRGVVLDEIFLQADRLGNISIERLSHYLDQDGIVKWNDNIDAEEEIESVTRFVELDRILYKDNDDGMLWGGSSTTVSPILREARHMDPLLHARLQWLAGLMSEGEGESAALVERYFIDMVHMTPRNYGKMRDRVIEVAGRIHERVESGEMQLDLDFEGTFRSILLREIESATAVR